MADPRQNYPQAPPPNPYAPQHQQSYSSGNAGSPPQQYNSPPQQYGSPPPPQEYNSYGQAPPGAQPPYNQFAPEKQYSESNSPNVQQPQASYNGQQPGPVVMSYNQPPAPQQGFSEKAPPQGYQPQPQQSYNQQQPTGQRAMDPYAAGGPGGQMPINAGSPRDWSHGLFDCFAACGTCCLATWCPCMAYQQVKNRLDHLQRTGRPDPQHGGSGCGGECCLYATLTGCFGLGWVFQMTTRSSMRTRYNINGDGCTDCLAAACCTACDLTQEQRELEVEEGKFLQ